MIIRVSTSRFTIFRLCTPNVVNRRLDFLRIIILRLSRLQRALQVFNHLDGDRAPAVFFYFPADESYINSSHSVSRERTHTLRFPWSTGLTLSMKRGFTSTSAHLMWCVVKHSRHFTHLLPSGITLIRSVHYLS